MRELWDTLVAFATRTMYALIFTLVIIGYTLYNLGSLNTIQNFGFSQYLNNIITLQLWDVQYKINKKVKFFDKPVSMVIFEETEPDLWLSPGNIINVSGTYTPDGGEVDWLATEIYVGANRHFGYVLAPGGSLGLFGGYVNSDEYFTLFDGYDKDNYENILAQEFYNEIRKYYPIKIESNRIEKQKFEEVGSYKKISSLFSDEILFMGIEKYSEDYYNREIYCNKDDYNSIKKLYNYYFNENYYSRLLNIFNNWEI